MAHTLRRPLCSAITLQRRALSLSAPRCAVRVDKPQRPRAAPEASLRLQQKAAQGILGDFGMLPETFVNPVWKNLPKLYDSGPPRTFPLLFMLYQRAFACVKGLGSQLILVWSSPRRSGFFDRSVKVKRKQIVPTAKVRHREMYTALANGDDATLQSICSDGLYTTMSSRIHARKRGETMQWELERYVGQPRVVSNLMGKMPIEGAAVHQAIVRIKSVQKITRYDARGKIMEGSGKAKTVVENVVMHKVYQSWKAGEWKIWGTTPETKYEEVKEWVKAK